MKFQCLFASALLFVCEFVAASDPFLVIASGNEVSDSATGLIWQRCVAGMVASGGSCTGTATTFSHQGALAFASAEASALGVAWRLPNVKELSSIVDRNRSNPAIDIAAFPQTPYTGFAGSIFQGFWSSSPVVPQPSQAWGVSFADGFVGVYSKSMSNTVAMYVRLVRAGQ
jgi:Protein of unknown function (DUF1566)